jgi:hypothetical protein
MEQLTVTVRGNRLAIDRGQACVASFTLEEVTALLPKLVSGALGFAALRDLEHKRNRISALETELHSLRQN